jgi:uncharacterized protein YndB with AHSA1/START domain
VWTQADHYETWFHAVPGSVELDVRPGGGWRATMSWPDGECPMTGSYHDVVPGRRLATAMDLPGRDPSLMVMDLTGQGGRTHVVVTQTCEIAEERDEPKAGTEMLLECARPTWPRSEPIGPDPGRPTRGTASSEAAPRGERPRSAKPPTCRNISYGLP